MSKESRDCERSEKRWEKKREGGELSPLGGSKAGKEHLYEKLKEEDLKEKEISQKLKEKIRQKRKK